MRLDFDFKGSGGWTWHTGSAGGLYRAALGSILGFQFEDGDTIILRPCSPAEGPG
jgi:cyclic beta-1,2-glucan synthetase